MPPPVMTPVASSHVSELSSPKLTEEYQNAQEKARSFNEKLNAIRSVERKARRTEKFSAFWGGLGWMGGWAREKAERLKSKSHELDVRRVNLEADAEPVRTASQFDVGDIESQSWKKVCAAFSKMANANHIWDLVARGGAERYKSSASHTVYRKPVRFGIGMLSSVRPDVTALHLQNANGSDLWIYPKVLVIGDDRSTPTFISISDVNVSCYGSRFVEDERVPQDAEQAGFTWRFVNRNGGPDRRFSHNPQMPVMVYGKLDLTSLKGLNEHYLISSKSKASDFADFLVEHQQELKNSSA